MSGTLYVVSTPIGNLEDITYRAVRILKEADLIACEDTRHTRRLMDHYGIAGPAISYHEHNEENRSLELLERLASGANVALVTDAGTPTLSDPGYRVVHAAINAGLPVVPIPGPSAALTALAGSGLPTDSFYFGGFLSAKRTRRLKTLRESLVWECVLIFYEAPHRLLETLEDIAEVFGERRVVIARELTKVHEEWARGSALALFRQFAGRPSVKGEITLLIDKGAGVSNETRSVAELVQFYMEQGLARMDAMKAAARDKGLSKRQVYAELER